MPDMPGLPTQIDNSAYVEKLINESLKRIRERIITQMDAHNRNASFAAIKSLHIQTTGVSGKLYGKRYFRAMETGRRAGKIPTGFASIIAQWIIDKGINVTLAPRMINSGGKRYMYYPNQSNYGAMIRSAAYLIARKIAHEGTMLHRMHVKQDIFSNVIEQEVQELSKRIGITLKSGINYIHRQYATP